MLETIRTYIQSIEDMSFDDYYRQYLERMSQRSLDLEFQYLSKSANAANILKIDAMISKYIDELVMLGGKQ